MNKNTLFLLHYAGGNYYSFRFMEPYLHDFECIPLELPGRGRRIYESCLNNFNDAAVEIADQIVNNLVSPDFYIYGHSMGAIMALRVAAILEKKNLIPSYLIVSGNAGPGIKEIEKKHLLGKEEFKQELVKLGGMPAEFYSNEELFDFFEPIIRADFELLETINYVEFTPVKASIYALMGNTEEDSESIENWKRFTLSDFNGEILEGHHFFIYKYAEKIAGIIKGCVKKVAQKSIS